MNRLLKQLIILGRGIWEFPQNLVGLFLLLVYHKRIDKKLQQDSGTIVFKADEFYGGISLGLFVFIISHVRDDSSVIRHELGHTVQSMILGPLYLLVIGIPSITWAGISTLSWKWFKYRIPYYKFYTEAWANKIAGIE